MIDPFGDLNRMAAEPPAHTWKAFIGMEQFVPLVIGRRSRRRHLTQPNGQMESSTATSVAWLRERSVPRLHSSGRLSVSGGRRGNVHANICAAEDLRVANCFVNTSTT